MPFQKFFGSKVYDSCKFANIYAYGVIILEISTGKDLFDDNEFDTELAWNKGIESSDDANEINRKGFLVLNLGCAVFLSVLDQTIVATALPKIVFDFNGLD
ncbi:hypothetical protein F8M41_015390 [Gigaspora margarita]|uniref:Uncharacterized protein n=1 Tax=Gigaspora margarita TaxID=4874 RepID=A0A8H3WWJ8_GIGMA|nr:hypothetical protein F8M41_015390 [Gigaspora margarita]